MKHISPSYILCFFLSVGIPALRCCQITTGCNYVQHLKCGFLNCCSCSGVIFVLGSLDGAIRPCRHGRPPSLSHLSPLSSRLFKPPRGKRESSSRCLLPAVCFRSEPRKTSCGYNHKKEKQTNQKSKQSNNKTRAPAESEPSQEMSCMSRVSYILIDFPPLSPPAAVVLCMSDQLLLLLLRSMLVKKESGRNFH